MNWRLNFQPSIIKAKNSALFITEFSALIVNKEGVCPILDKSPLLFYLSAMQSQ
nr:MAG TPA: hypothetical protein [Caudoviricetes sp.]